MLLEFALGMAAYLLWRDNRLSPRLRFVSGIIGAAILVAEALLGSGVAANPALAISGETAMLRVVRYALPTFLLINFLVGWEPRDTIVRKGLVTIGDASYSIYLVHLFVISLLIGRIPLPPDGRWVALFVLALLAGVIVYFCLEKPFARLAAKVGKPRDTQVARPVEVGAP
jgi:peptidoglycan/LPS O-acetylase OafA/YrhL